MRRTSPAAYAGIDIGADRIRLIDKDKGIVFDEPCAVALDKRGNTVAIGEEALEMKDLSDAELQVILPLQQEEMDFDALEALLEELCYENRVIRLFSKPTFLVSYPSYFDEEDVEQLKDHLISLGARDVYAEEQVWIAAIGAGLNLNLPASSVVLHVGHNNCDIALFSRGRMQNRQSGTLTGKGVSDMIAWYLRTANQIEVSDAAIETIKKQIGTTRMKAKPASMEVKGIDTVSHTMKKAVIDSNQIASILAPLVREWSAWIGGFLGSLPMDVQKEVMMRGIVCCGGAMQLDGLSDSIQKLVGAPFFVTDDPAGTVAAGLMILMNRMESQQDS